VDKQSIQKPLRLYLKNVQKHIKISKVILFGSIARDKSTANDVDLIVLSDDFKTLDSDERLRLLYRASVGFPFDLHVFGFTPQELAHASPLTALGQLKHTKTINFS